MANFGSFLSHLHSVAGYASICAIESPSKNDDEQWLAYWILYSFLTLMEMVAEPVLYCVPRIPVWYQIKVIFVAWLVLPHFRGASFMYERFVREQLIKYGVKLGTSSPHNNKVEE
ncbi:protein HVA22 isoform X3 [Musa acuminata AAA Group]|uniref:protein HVA22 isoform X3 n=1 Tax=Musa acuminata AAA Group TaxID=214697 RepID=UPI0031D32262